MSLRDWLAARWVSAHESSRDETARLLGVAEQNLRDSGVTGISADLRLSAAYNAALQLATAAIAAEGYRVGRERHHERTIESLAHTIGAEPALVRRLDAYRRKRNVTWYEQAGVVSDAEAEEMREFAEQLRDRVVAWLRERHPELL
jgi:hypothetical protein